MFPFVKTRVRGESFALNAPPCVISPGSGESMGSQQHGFRSGIICSAALAALLTVLASTQGWADFGAPVTLSAANGNAIGPQVAVDSDGDAVIVWQFSKGSSRQIQIRSRSKSGALGPIQTISSPLYVATDPQVAIDSDGDALIVWVLDNRLVQARFRSKNGALSAVQNSDGTGDQWQPNQRWPLMPMAMPWLCGAHRQHDPGASPLQDRRA